MKIDMGELTVVRRIQFAQEGIGITQAPSWRRNLSSSSMFAHVTWLMACDLVLFLRLLRAVTICMIVRNSAMGEYSANHKRRWLWGF